MNNFQVLSSHLHPTANAAESIVKLKFGLNNVHVEKAFDSGIGLEPTLHWKTPYGYVICEVAEKPLPVSVHLAYPEIVASGLPVKVIIAYPSNHTITQNEYLKEANKARKFGLGLLSINENGTGNFEHTGIDLSLYAPEPSLASFSKSIRTEIVHAYGLYINGDPKHGVQALGQMVENIIVNLADQAKKQGNLTTGGFQSKDVYYAPANLVDDLTRQSIIDPTILARCRGFIADRNKTSHKPKTLAQAQALNKKLKNAWLDGLRIIEEIPALLKLKGYKFKI